MDKKAISAVVATVLIILITVAAVTIIWAAIIPMINNQISGGTQCLDAVSQLQLVTDQGYTCKNADNISLHVKLGASAVGVDDMQILVSAGGDTTSFKYSNATTKLSGTLPTKNGQSVIVINTAGITGISEVSIAPIVTVGNTRETCDVSSTVTLSDCS